jgi:rubredoxin
MRIKFMKCPHVRCGSRMQRMYVRNPEKTFVPIGWRCPECGIMISDLVVEP